MGVGPITPEVAHLAPLDSDLTAIAALSTTAFGRALLELADAAAARTALALGSAATSNTSAFDAAGTGAAAAAAAQAASQPLDSDLTEIAALSTTSYGRALLELADQAALLSAVGQASTTTAGVVELATSAETAAASDATRAVTPSAAASTYGAQIWIPAAQLTPSTGSAPVLNRTAASRWPAITFADAATEIAAVSVPIPETWATFDVHLYWTCLTTATGNVRWVVIRDRAGAGDSLNVSGSNATATASSPGQYLLAVTACSTGIAAVPDDLCNLRVQRTGADAADTLAASVELIGVMLSRAS